MIERRLCLEQVARIFKDDSRVGVARLMDVDSPHLGLRRVLLQVVGVRLRRQWQARLAGAIVASPERVIGMQSGESFRFFSGRPVGCPSGPTGRPPSTKSVASPKNWTVFDQQLTVEKRESTDRIKGHNMKSLTIQRAWFSRCPGARPPQNPRQH